MTMGESSIEESKQFYEGIKKFWRLGISINLVFLECRNNHLDPFIKIMASDCTETLSKVAPPLFLDTNKLRIIVENAAISKQNAESKSKQDRNLRRMSGTNFSTRNLIVGLNKYTLDLLAKYLFDRVILSKKLSTQDEFAIELMQLAGDDIGSDGRLAFEMVMTDYITITPPQIQVSQNIVEFEKKTATFAVSAADCHSTYQIARNHSIACLKSIRNFNIMKKSDGSQPNLPTVKEFKTKSKSRNRRSKVVKDSRFGSLIDSFFEQGSEMMNSVRISSDDVFSARYEPSQRIAEKSIKEGKPSFRDFDNSIKEEFRMSGKANRVFSEKQLFIGGSSDTNIIGSFEETNAPLFPSLTATKTERSSNLFPLAGVGSALSTPAVLSRNHPMNVIEEAADKNFSMNDLKLTTPNTIKEVYAKLSSKEPSLEPEPSFTFYLPKLSKNTKEPKSPQTASDISSRHNSYNGGPSFRGRKKTSSSVVSSTGSEV